MDRKQAWLKGASSAALQRIVWEQGDEVPTPERPLAGKAHIEGIGWVLVSDMRNELRGRRYSVERSVDEFGNPRFWVVDNTTGDDVGSDVYDTYDGAAAEAEQLRKEA
jgi:hypothetical protein